MQEGHVETRKVLTEKQLALLIINLPNIDEIKVWAKEQSSIEPTGAEEFGRIYGALWMRNIILKKIKP